MKYLVIGASAAGISAAKRLRRLDSQAEITVISKDEEVYSRCMLHYLIGGERELEELKFITDDFWQKYDIDWIKGKEVKAVKPDDDYVKLADDTQIAYDQLLIATGAKPFFPPIKNLDKGQEVFGLRDLEDAEEIVEAAAEIEEAVIIGAGLVGMDAAIALNELEIDVSVVEFEDSILPFQLDKAASARFESRFQDEGVKILTNSSAQELIVDKKNHVQGLKLDNGQELSAQLVIVATGVRANTELVKATELEVEQGIIVNQYQQSSVENVYAAGDVAQSKEVFSGDLTLTPIWPLAVKQGKIAAQNMAGKEEKITDNFAYQNSMRFLGLSAITYGVVDVDSDDYEVYINQDKANYKKLILKDNQLRGAIFLGDIKNSGVYGKLIKEGIDLADKKDRLFELSYGDFFQAKENGEFKY